MTLKQESTESEKNLNNVIKIDPRQIQNHLDQMVRGTVEEKLNSMLDAEADQIDDNVGVLSGNHIYIVIIANHCGYES